jgi:hypothetical protein
VASQSPLTDEPLRLPGQTLDEKIQWWQSDGIVSYIAAAAMFFVMAVMEWVGYVTHAPRSPIFFSACALGAIAVLVARICYVRTELHKLKLGRHGERVVGQYLEGFRARGGRVFHDIPGDNFNVDHVLICPQGVYAIETKTWSKPWPRAKVVSRNGKLLKAGFDPDRDASHQALHSARWLQDLLESKTGGIPPVRAVVAIPGWSIDKGLEHGTVCIIEPKDFPDYIEQRPITLSTRDVRLLSAHLSRYVRAAQRTARA